MSSSRTRALGRQAATNASLKFEAQLMSSPNSSPSKSDGGTPAKRRAKSRGGAGVKSQPAAKSARRPPLQTAPKSQLARRKRAVSLDSRRSDNDESSDLTSLSAASETPLQTSSWLDNTSQFSKNYVFVLLDFHGQVCGLDDEDDGEERIWWPGVVSPAADSTYRVQLFGTIASLPPNALVEMDSPHEGNILPICKDGTEDKKEKDHIQFTTPKYVVSGQSPRKRQRLDRSDLEAQWQAALSDVVTYILANEVPSINFLGSISKIQLNDTKSLVMEVDAAAPAEMEEMSDTDSDPDWTAPPADISLEIPGELVLARDKKKKYWPARITDYVPPPNRHTLPQYRIVWLDNSTGIVTRAEFYAYQDDGFGTCSMGQWESEYQEVVNDEEEDEPKEDDRGESPEPSNPAPSSGDFEQLSVHEQFVYVKPVLTAILRDKYEPAREGSNKYFGGGKRRQEVVKDAGARGLMDPRDVEMFKKCLEEWCLRRPAVGKRDEEADVAGGADDATPTPNVKAVIPLPVVEVAPEVIDAALQETLCSPPSPTETSRIECPSSPALPPPSSSLATLESTPELDEMVEAKDVPSPTSAGEDIDPFDTSSILSEASDVSSLLLSARKKEKSPRQVGCPAYEALSEFEKADYCLNVLLPQLIIQVLLWRTGARTSVALLALEEEARLNAVGVAERAKTDWVFDVRRLRAQKEKEMGLMKEVEEVSTSRRGRTRNRRER
ncbi:hypothetical protein FB45DRAFT_914402 [Roridomyces roridus]|uniref:PWWP domain-containing protein n=1 Tax=Roridomyces roridus TaxID=1738132 RepID=A0AAD7BXN0_9AGAR|nr:hypothetical protein FB45DRAFT_914402 [Roridomyces roridus]